MQGACTNNGVGRWLDHLARITATGTLKLRTKESIARIRLQNGVIQHCKFPSQASAENNLAEALSELLDWDVAYSRFVFSQMPSPQKKNNAQAVRQTHSLLWRAAQRESGAADFQFKSGSWVLSPWSLPLIRGVVAQPLDLALLESFQNPYAVEFRISDLRSVLHAAVRLGALVPYQGAGSCRMLLRKHQELRRGADDQHLLDLDRQPQLQSRKALQRIVTQIHPDHFAKQSDQALQSASTRVLRKLIDAERKLSAAIRR